MQTILDLDKPNGIITPGEKITYSGVLTKKIHDLEHSEINMDYWENADYNYSKLALFFIDSKNHKEESEWEKLIESFREKFEKYGSIGKKKAETYNLLMMLDALDVLKKDKNGDFSSKQAQIFKLKLGKLKLE